MLKIKELIQALQQLDSTVQELPICAVFKARETLSGPMEGAIMLFNKPAIGAAMTPEGLYIFTEEEGELRENYMYGMMPSEFKTGNPDIDSRGPDSDAGEEWKKA